MKSRLLPPKGKWRRRFEKRARKSEKRTTVASAAGGSLLDSDAIEGGRKPGVGLRRRRPALGSPKDRRNLINRIVENRLISRVSYEEYRDKVRNVYDGPKGMILPAASLLSLHVPLGERLLRQRKFDLRGTKRLLDVGSGAGQIARHVLKYADADTSITCTDLSFEMLRRARRRLKSDVPSFFAADLVNLPFADGSFDCITCGYVLEHLPDARAGLAEMARVLEPGGRILLLTSEDNMGGALTSALWYCRTYNRRELQAICASVGLKWHKELWFTRLHKLLRAGGICVELVKT